jgi:murein DD-endopeptidase MepM/ murein hydrolase activator NlpD
MRRRIARHMSLWMKLFLVSLAVFVFFELPPLVELVTPFALLALAFVRPAPNGRDAQVVRAPVRGRWTALNSPATKVPSHGIKAYGQTYAIDILHPRPADAPASIGWGVGMRAATTFPTFGEPVLAVADGTVVHVSDGQRDHRSRQSWPALAYMMVVEGAVRELGGPRFVLGNHVVVRHDDGVFAAYAHLRRGSIGVAEGDTVAAGSQLAEVGNTGNTTEPHLHVQLMDRAHVTEAAGVPFRWSDVEITDDVDRSFTKAPATDVEPGLPANGQIFTVA